MMSVVSSSGGKVVGITMQRVEQLSIQLPRRRLRLKAIEVLPADQTAQRHLTAARTSVAFISGHGHRARAERFVFKSLGIGARISTRSPTKLLHITAWTAGPPYRL